MNSGGMNVNSEDSRPAPERKPVYLCDGQIKDVCHREIRDGDRYYSNDANGEILCPECHQQIYGLVARKSLF